MKKKRVLIFTLAVLLAVVYVQYSTAAGEEIRVWGGKNQDFKDAKGRIWFGGQKNKQPWGGWVDLLPLTAEVQQLTKDAEKKAKDAGYDKELFYAVSWASFPNTVKVDLNTGNGTFDVTYLVGEHWSPNNRGYDIFIEDENVEPLYVTPGQNEIDIRIYEGIEVTDKVMNFHFAGNPKTGKGDLNAMYSALEVVPALAVDAKKKLTTTWGEIKRRRQD